MDEFLDFLLSGISEMKEFEGLGYIMEMMKKAGIDELKDLKAITENPKTTLEDILKFLDENIDKKYPKNGEKYIQIKDITSDRDVIKKGKIHTVESVDKGVVTLSSNESLGSLSFELFNEFFKPLEEKNKVEEPTGKLILNKEYEILGFKFKILEDYYIGKYLCLYNKDKKQHFEVAGMTDKDILDLVYNTVLEHMKIS